MRFLAAIKLGSKSKCVDPKAKPNRNFFRDNLCLPLESAFINRKHSFQNSRSNYVAPPLTLHPSFDSVLCPSFDSFGYLASPRIWTSCKTDRRDKWGGAVLPSNQVVLLSSMLIFSFRNETICFFWNYVRQT